jgi:hypothetical protein
MTEPTQADRIRPILKKMRDPAVLRGTQFMGMPLEDLDLAGLQAVVCFLIKGQSSPARARQEYLQDPSAK